MRKDVENLRDGTTIGVRRSPIDRGDKYDAGKRLEFKMIDTEYTGEDMIDVVEL